MELFTCDRCDTVDSSELIPQQQTTSPKLCTICLGLPWHNQFPQRAYNPKVDLVNNRPSGIGLG